MSTAKTYTHPNDGLYYNQEYSITRWQNYYHNLHGCYYLVCMNDELYKMQGLIFPHLICIVDDFGNLVRKP